MFSKYILIILWIGFAAVLAALAPIKKKELVLGVETRRLPWWFAFLVFIPIIILVGTRGLAGADSMNYTLQFLSIPRGLGRFVRSIFSVSKDVGFYIFAGVIKQFIGNNTALYFTILATIQSVLLLSVYRKYSSNYMISVFLFMASADYVSWMFNVIRQFMAVTIIFAATTLILKKKYLPMIIVILFASTFHSSALIMLPFIFIAQGKAFNKWTIIFMISVLATFFFVDQFTDVLGTVLAGTATGDITENYIWKGDNGTNPVRVAVYAVPAIIAFIGRRQVRAADDKVINLCVNMSVISVGFYILSMFTSGIYIGRLPIYFSLYGYILLPWEINNLFSKESKRFVYAALIVLYLAYYYYQMHFGLAYPLL